ncbi:Ser/Thr protein kinase RdoA (MazF antagonist) [Paenibacillus sp. V4I9]|uniref:phosphotransferase enzyme family protein n=1 Tax=Paenibacillus sp. V4I9 TaxID=3042308 RepID=UPI002782A251|nr:phosphotransferase [Paenibacillus sp. V4I9]MDQ0888779.1 Ser/Thr protein kinase RdoA (MazF antagonist) [Paenibacillus sp. V4I9]
MEKYIGILKLSDISFFKTRSKLMHEHLSQLPSGNEAFGLIHGDLNLSNVHYSPEHGFKIFDFDHCAYGWRIHDLAVTKLCFNQRIYNQILEGYQLIRPLSLLEEKSIDIYSDVLLLRKSKDILDMMKSEGSPEEQIRGVVTNAIDTLNMLFERPFN